MCQHSLARGLAGSMRRVTAGHAIRSGGGSFVRRLGFYIYAFCCRGEVVYICAAAARLKSLQLSCSGRTRRCSSRPGHQGDAPRQNVPA